MNKLVWIIAATLSMAFLSLAITIAILEISNQTVNVGESFTLLDDVNKEHVCQITDNDGGLILECLGIK